MDTITPTQGHVLKMASEMAESNHEDEKCEPSKSTINRIDVDDEFNHLSAVEICEPESPQNNKSMEPNHLMQDRGTAVSEMEEPQHEKRGWFKYNWRYLLPWNCCCKE